MDNTQKLLESFLKQPTTYTIDVLDNTMLPDGIKDKKQLKFTIKRPTLKVLASTALPLSKIPKEIREKERLTLTEIVPYAYQIAEVVARMAHGANPKPMPDWYVPFFLANLTDKELYAIFEETAMKADSSFFLSCIHNASQTNPMMIEDLTPTS